MRRKAAKAICGKAVWVLYIVLLTLVGLAAQGPGAFSTLTTTSTTTTSVRVGCTAGSTTCTGGIKSGPVDVSSVTSSGFVEIANNVPGATTNRLYNNAGTLFWNGSALATGSALSGTLGKIPKFTGASSLGDSLLSESGATVTMVGTLAATTFSGSGASLTALPAAQLTGTITAATQDLITRLGVIVSGTWNSTIVGLTYGGTGANLSGTGGTSQFLRQNTVGGTVTVVRPAVSDLSDASNVGLINASNSWSGATNAFLAMTANSLTINTVNGLSLTSASVGIETGSTGSANTPFIDFHSSGNNIDYDARIVASAGSGVVGAGTVSVTAGLVVFSSNARGAWQATDGTQGTTGVCNFTAGSITIKNGLVITCPP